MHRTSRPAPENKKRGCGWTHAAPSQICHEAENKSQMPYHYSRRSGRNLKANSSSFGFDSTSGRWDAVHFPAGKSGNVIRGALGRILRDTASPAAYARLFEPGSDLGRAPSGFGDWPRPFILRTDAPGWPNRTGRRRVCFDIHIFDRRPAVLAYFHEAFAQFGNQGIGPGHGRASLERTEQLDLDDRAEPVAGAAAAGRRSGSARGGRWDAFGFVS
jgi:hypothetical protein